MKIATQGREASFHYQACEVFFKDQPHEVQGFDSFAETFESLQNGTTDYAVVAIENSIHGAINEAYDLLDQHHFWIAGELYLPIRQCLIGFAGTKLAEITAVYSHFAALSQCREFLDTKLSQAVRHVHPDTAGAVADIAQWANPHNAAIASAFAADYYHLEVLAANIETNHHNYTRFALLQREQQVSPHAAKTTLLLQLHSHTGALHEVLGVLAAHNLDLTMLVSRPIVGEPGNYRFYIDLTTAASNPAFRQAVQKITEAGNTIRILGSYHPLNTVEQLAAS